MHHLIRRMGTALLALVLVLGTAPVIATDEVAPEELPVSPPTIHAEMAAAAAVEAATNPMTFTRGAVPAPIAENQVAAPGGTAAVAGGLPNGLGSEVLGYLPYWALTSELLPSLRYDLVSTIAYFGVPALSTGSLQKSGTYWNGWASTHMTNVIDAAHAEGVEVVLTVTMMAWDGDYAAMTALLTNATRRAQLAADIASTVSARNADGVNLDFEPMPNSLQSAYVTFVRQVKAALGSRQLTVATTGGAATWDEGYDLAALVAPGAADAIMAMGYDYNWSGSSRAGGVAPIVSPYALDVDTALADYLEVVPPSKLIWGVPYYGRAWTTQSSAQNALTCKNASICPDGDAAAGAFGRSYAQRYLDARSSAASHGRRWDATGQVAWYRFQSTTYDTWVQGYYEDAQSLDVKMDRVNGAGLRGIGIWHLLMDAGRAELWDTLGRNMLDLPFTDIDDSTHWKSIVWIAEQGITSGCGSFHYCPDGLVTRGQMATFLSRALDLPTASSDHFTDDETSTHEGAINRIAEAGITIGCSATRYCPNGLVTRAQMATFLTRAFDVPWTPNDHFTDDEGNTHESGINRIAEAGITVGCGPSRYCPDGIVTRAQMATFLKRALEG
jgi:spore germination protein YaaH